MAVTATQIATLRRMVAESTTATYSDALLTAIIEAYPLPDERGIEPYTFDFSTTPPTHEANASWIETYDLNRAAAQVWEDKAAAVSSKVDSGMAGTTLARSQQYSQYSRQARRYLSKSAPKSMSFLKVEYERGIDGTIRETIPIIDRADSDQPMNALTQ